MKLYIASSWKNQHAVEMLTDILRANGHEVVSFVEAAAKDSDRKDGSFDFEKWIHSDDGRDRFSYDTNGATTSDMVIYIGPSGTDAWAEVGAAWSALVPVVGLWAKGEQSGLMRYMVQWYNDYREIVQFVNEIENAKETAYATAK